MAVCTSYCAGPSEIFQTGLTEPRFRSASLRTTAEPRFRSLALRGKASLGRYEAGFLVPQARVSKISQAANASTQSSSILDQPVDGARKLLCLSNGHGEDAVAVAILEELKTLGAELGQPVSIQALPLVGLGAAYAAAQIPVVGPAKPMPSGGFIYMDSRQLLGDVQAGLLGLLADQVRSISQWGKEHPDGAILAVGDVFPLALAWLTPVWRSAAATEMGQRHLFGFVGTAKSEYYLRDDEGQPLKAKTRSLAEALISPGSVYLPWERAMMASGRCRLVAPRDGLTARTLQKELPFAARWKVVDLGNPMMDKLEPRGILEGVLQGYKADCCLALLPGTRAPEVHSNWQLLLECVRHTVAALAPRQPLFLAPIVPSLPLETFVAALRDAGWQPLDRNPAASPSPSAGRAPASTPPAPTRESESSPGAARARSGAQAGGAAAHGDGLQAPSSPTVLTFYYGQEGSRHVEEAELRPTLVLVHGHFADCAHAAQAAIAMAGTGTEQLVGLGKAAFTIAGGGPQFSHAFAEAQSRLLGKSVVFCQDPASLATTVVEVMGNEALVAEIAENGRSRMGGAGSSRRIAEHVWSSLLDAHRGYECLGWCNQSDMGSASKDKGTCTIAVDS